MTSFPKLRRLLTVSAVVSPLFFLLAFLCYAADLDDLALLPLFLGALLLLGFPLERRQEDGPPNLGWRVSQWLGGLAFLSFVFWLFDQPEVAEFLERDNHVLWDWRLVLAVVLWTVSWSLSNYLKAQALKDRDIVEIYDDES